MHSHIILLLEAAAMVSAFPHMAEMAKSHQLNKRIAPVAPFPEYPGSPAHANYDNFDAASQLIDVTGEHAWAAPTAGQIRGPCAGLNAAANHGYIPRSGIATADSISQGLWQAFSLSLDATTFLETATRFFDGNPITGEWSIGPASSAVNLIDGTTPSGICEYGHLKTEADASITRGDFLAPTKNNNCDSYPEFLQDLFDLANEMNPTTGWLDARVMAQHSSNRKVYSIENNPNYFAPVYAGVAFTFGAHMFASVLLSNHSAEYPRGFQTQENFLALWGYTRDASNNLVWTPGSERIPDNYYKRAEDDAWTLSDIAISTAQQCAAYPSNCQVGGNTGTVNSFSGFDLGDLSGGFVNSVNDLSDPTRAGCFISQAIQADVPSFLDRAFEGPELSTALGLIPTLLLPALQPLGNCPNLPAGKSVYAYGAKYPGAQIH